MMVAEQDLHGQKVSRIFEAFDTNHDGALSKVSLLDHNDVCRLDNTKQFQHFLSGRLRDLTHPGSLRWTLVGCTGCPNEDLQAYWSLKLAEPPKALDRILIACVQAELLTFVARVNPSVKFTPAQLTAIADEVRMANDMSSG